MVGPARYKVVENGKIFVDFAAAWMFF